MGANSLLLYIGKRSGYYCMGVMNPYLELDHYPVCMSLNFFLGTFSLSGVRMSMLQLNEVEIFRHDGALDEDEAEVILTLLPLDRPPGLYSQSFLTRALTWGGPPPGTMSLLWVSSKLEGR